MASKNGKICNLSGFSVFLIVLAVAIGVGIIFMNLNNQFDWVKILN